MKGVTARRTVSEIKDTIGILIENLSEVKELNKNILVIFRSSFPQLSSSYAAPCGRKITLSKELPYKQRVSVSLELWNKVIYIYLRVTKAGVVTYTDTWEIV
jgi:hypothetical protein